MKTSSSLVFVALGSNLGDRRQLIRQALDRLQSYSLLPLLRSGLWQTTPVDCPPGSPGFLNAVAGLDVAPDETPESLLDKLQHLEQEFGRRPKRLRNESRPLDLDLIAFGRERRATDRLVLPHPRAHLRKFVLAPLNEIAPNLLLPGQTHTVRQLLAECATGEVVHRLDSV